jgi:hypothetical protein
LHHLQKKGLALLPAGNDQKFSSFNNRPGVELLPTLGGLRPNLFGGIMFRKALSALAVLFSAFALAASVSAHGQVWDFLGDTHLRGTRDHDRIEVTRHDAACRAIQLRVSDEPIFFDHVIVHLGNGTSQTFAVGDRISPQGKNYVVALDGQAPVDSVELWYFKEPWTRNPRVILYGAN